jgi:hypothetical protein
MPDMIESTGREIPVVSPGEGADIQPLLAHAIAEAAPGDTVVLPSGSFRLEGGLRVRGGDVKRLTLRGQGKNRTRLYKSGRSAESRFMISFEGGSDPDEVIQVFGITFEGAPARALDENGQHEDIGLRLIRCIGFTIHNCRFTSFGHAAVQIRHAPDAADGLLYNNEFTGNHHADPRPDPVENRNRVSSLGYGVEVRADLTDGMNSDDQWVREPNPGGQGFIFIEDNYFTGHRHAVAAGEGGLYVFRNNLVDRNLTAHAVDAHGAGAHANSLSTRFYEVYRNHLISASSRDAGAGGFEAPNFAMAFRGGEGVIFSNTGVGFPAGVRLAVEVPSSDYPVPYQIGWESATNHTPNPDPDHRGIEPSELVRGDVFLWDNHFEANDGHPVNELHIGSGDVHLLVANRDYHRLPRPGYEPFTYPHPRAAHDHLAFPYPLHPDFDSALEKFFDDSSNAGLESADDGTPHIGR